ncbi:hypothetical protein BJY52DRAFT_1188028 [Lactarius psammicola]|nr:hypothetical protein BJY52DRAFT_1188028 [Lactarius psammicola]
MRLQNPQKSSEKQSVPQLDFVHVDGWYRIGKLLGSGGSGSVYLGRDIRTGAEIVLKIGRLDHSPLAGLSHEFNVYTKVAGGTGISPVHWYGKEGPYDIIVLEHLGTSLGDLVSEQRVNHNKTFCYASQMVCSHPFLTSYHHHLPRALVFWLRFAGGFWDFIVAGVVQSSSPGPSSFDVPTIWTSSQSSPYSLGATVLWLLHHPQPLFHMASTLGPPLPLLTQAFIPVVTIL